MSWKIGIVDGAYRASETAHDRSIRYCRMAYGYAGPAIQGLELLRLMLIAVRFRIIRGELPEALTGELFCLSFSRAKFI